MRAAHGAEAVFASLAPRILLCDAISTLVIDMLGYNKRCSDNARMLARDNCERHKYRTLAVTFGGSSARARNAPTN